MAVSTIHSNFGNPKNTVYHCFNFFSFYWLSSDGTRSYNLSFLNVQFQASFFFFSLLFPFTLNKRLLVPLHCLWLEWYHLHIWGCWYFSWQSWLQLMIHPPGILHDVFDINWISKVTIYSLVLTLSQLCIVSVACLVLTIASWPAYKLLRTLVRWYVTPISKNFPQSVVFHRIKTLP